MPRILSKESQAERSELQAANRPSKQSAKDVADYLAFYNSIGHLLIAAAPLVIPPSTTPHALSTKDTLATLAERLVEALRSFALNGHLARVSPEEVQLPFLQQLARLLGSEHLPLSVATLPAWRRLVQAHERSVNRAEGVPHAKLHVCLTSSGMRATLASVGLTAGEAWRTLPSHRVIPPLGASQRRSRKTFLAFYLQAWRPQRPPWRCPRTAFSS